MKVVDIQNRIRDKAWNYLKGSFYHHRLVNPPILQNINFSPVQDQKRVIICYQTTSHFFDLDEESKGRTQPYEILSIIKVFSELNYCIDVIGCNDLQALNYVSNKKYDVIFGFGEAFYQLTNYQPDAISVLYMTEHHPAFSYKEEQKRLDYFYARHKRTTNISRSGLYYKLHHLNRKYSYVITLSEIEPFIAQYKKPYSLFPTGIFNINYSFKRKNFEIARKHFLWLGSKGVIHKGLDLLIDIFQKRSDVILHIGGLSKAEKKVLPWKDSSNIIDHGQINIRSDLFLKIVEQCAYIILPSCSEGFSTSISTGMLHGLIPVVMKGTGFNRLNNKAVLLEDYKIEYIESALNELANKSSHELNEVSNEVFKFAHQNFSVKAFKENIQEIIVEILNKNA